MLFLNDGNQIVDSDHISKQCYYNVLKCKDPENTDFFCNLLTYIEEFSSCRMEVVIGEKYTIYVPFHWSILCSEGDTVENIPLYNISGRQFTAFCFNPIDSSKPTYLSIELGEIFSSASWTSPPVADKEFLVVPMPTKIIDSNRPNKGPNCVMMTPHKLDINKTVGDIIG